MVVMPNSDAVCDGHRSTATRQMSTAIPVTDYVDSAIVLWPSGRRCFFEPLRRVTVTRIEYAVGALLASASG